MPEVCSKTRQEMEKRARRSYTGFLLLYASYPTNKLWSVFTTVLLCTIAGMQQLQVVEIARLYLPQSIQRV